LLRTSPRIYCAFQAISARDISTLTACDIEFYDVLITASGNATLKKTLNQLRDSVRRFRAAFIALPGRPEEVLHDHLAIAQAVLVFRTVHVIMMA
jgi:DNA-binding FadR family transcriptional regulator